MSWKRDSTVAMSSNLLDSVVLQKEKEWKEAFQLRVRALEESVVLKEKELKQEKLRFLKLKEDFEYNLKLLIERDEELEKYDAVIGKIKQAEHVKTAEVSELYVKIDELKMNLENEQKAKDELQKHYQKVCIFSVIVIYRVDLLPYRPPNYRSGCATVF